MRAARFVASLVIAAQLVATVQDVAAQAAHGGGTPIWRFYAVMGGLVVVIGLLGWVIWKQRRVRDADDTNRATALSYVREIVLSGVYLYALDSGFDHTADRETQERTFWDHLRFGWNDASPNFPLDWAPGSLKGKLVRDFIPAGPEGDEARRAFVAVILDRQTVHYVREDEDRHGRRAWCEFQHGPTPDGGGVGHAYAVTSFCAENEAVRAERDELRARLQRLDTATIHRAAAEVAVNQARAQLAGDVALSGEPS